MKSLKNGKNISARVESISRFGLWLFVREKEYFLSFKYFPFFKRAGIDSVLNVKLLHGKHLHWPDLDIDLEIDVLENPKKFPLLYK